MNQQAIWKRCLAIFDNNNVIGVHLIMGAIEVNPVLKSPVLPKTISPKAVIFSDYCCTFAMSLMILLVLICSTKVSEKSDMAKS